MLNEHFSCVLTKTTATCHNLYIKLVNLLANVEHLRKTHGLLVKQKDHNYSHFEN